MDVASQGFIVADRTAGVVSGRFRCEDGSHFAIFKHNIHVVRQIFKCAAAIIAEINREKYFSN